MAKKDESITEEQIREMVNRIMSKKYNVNIVLEDRTVTDLWCFQEALANLMIQLIRPEIHGQDHESRIQYLIDVLYQRFNRS